MCSKFLIRADNVNESRQIGLVVYNAAIVISVMLPIIYYLQTISPSFSDLARALLTSYVVLFSLLVLYAYRYAFPNNFGPSSNLMHFPAWFVQLQFLFGLQPYCCTGQKNAYTAEIENKPQCQFGRSAIASQLVGARAFYSAC